LLLSKKKNRIEPNLCAVVEINKGKCYQKKEC